MNQLKKLIPDIVAIVLFAIISVAYFFPAITEGRILAQHDAVAGIGAGREHQEYYEKHGKATRWTNSLFSGMPTYQLAPGYESSRTLNFVQEIYRLFLPTYAGYIFIMLLGYVLHRTGFLSDAFVAGANKFVFYVALPVQLFRDLGKNDVRATFDGRYVLFCFAVTLACILVIWALAKLFLKGTGLVGEFVQVCYRSSAAILGSAFLQSIYGDASMSSLMILGSVPLYNIMAVVILMLEAPTAQAQTGNMAEKLKKSVKGILTNPILLGIAAGFAWSMLHISMPAMLDKALSNVAGLTSPLALLAIGAGFKGKKALGYLKPTAVATVVKLMVLPALFLPLAVRFGFTDEKLVALLVMLGSITTPACYVMAKQMGHEGVLTGSVCVTTTLFSAFSLTFWLFVLRSLGYIL